MTRESTRGAGILSLCEPMPINSPAALTLDVMLELAEELNAQQLELLATRIERLRVERLSLTTAETESLTDREKEVLVLVASGYNRKEIGRSLAISACTAAKHISNIYRKLGISTVAEATQMALVHKVSPVN